MFNKTKIHVLEEKIDYQFLSKLIRIGPQLGLIFKTQNKKKWFSKTKTRKDS